jgi:DNA repair protein RecN (Recombination protein N)
MLVSLYIKNYALIEELTFSPSKGLNVVTGETGAGKSIIFDALGLILGQRADAVSFYQQNEKCIIEGEFEITEEKFNPFFEENGLDFEKQTLIRREIATNGRSRSFINDTPVSLQQLKELGILLVDIHSQHETIEIFKPEKQLAIVDFAAGVRPLVTSYKLKFSDLSHKRRGLIGFQKSKSEALQQQNYFEFLLDELNEFNPTPEDEELENRLDKLSNSEEIKNGGLEFVHLVSEGENSVINQLSGLEKMVGKLDTYFGSLKLAERYKNILVELNELSIDISSETEAADSDEKVLLELEERFKKLQDLMAKHQKQSPLDLIEVRDSLAQQVLSTAVLDDKITNLESDISSIEKDLNNEADDISFKRSSALQLLENALKSDLSELEMADAQIQFKLVKTDVLGSNGKDEIEILFSANKNRPPQALQKVASGGEASRLALALKAISGKETNTLIFDEIDTGISGKVAKKVGELLHSLGKNQQVISITHSPQVASSADAHFYVSKNKVDDSVTTKMERLNSDTQLKAIAEMLSGSQLTQEALENARTLIQASAK